MTGWFRLPLRTSNPASIWNVSLGKVLRDSTDAKPFFREERMAIEIGRAYDARRSSPPPSRPKKRTDFPAPAPTVSTICRVGLLVGTQWSPRQSTLHLHRPRCQGASCQKPPLSFAFAVSGWTMRNRASQAVSPPRGSASLFCPPRWRGPSPPPLELSFGVVLCP